MVVDARPFARQGRWRYRAAPIRDRFPHFADLLASEPEADQFACLRAAESVGRPLGDDRFLARIERRAGRLLKPAKRGPKPATAEP